MKTAFVDVDTQIDFMLPAGALYVPGAERILPRIAALNQWAAAHGIPVISTMDAHSENDAEFTLWPPHCVAGTHGQRKPESTLVQGQRFVRKQTLDCFSSPEMEAVLAAAGAERFVVYGVVTEYCVKLAVLGLLARGARVEVVTEAVRHLDENARRAACEEIARRGGVLVNAAEACAE